MTEDEQVLALGTLTAGVLVAMQRLATDPEHADGSVRVPSGGSPLYISIKKVRPTAWSVLVEHRGATPCLVMTTVLL